MIRNNLSIFSGLKLNSSKDNPVFQLISPNKQIIYNVTVIDPKDEHFTIISELLSFIIHRQMKVL